MTLLSQLRVVYRGQVDDRGKQMPHSMHDADPELFATTVLDWVAALNR